MPYNVDNNTQANKSQDSNFLIVQSLIRNAWKLGLSGIEYQVFLYQIDQEFGFIRNGKLKDGDKVSHESRSKHLGITERAEINATQELENRGVLFIDRKHRTVNRYHINRDVSMWMISHKISSPTDNTTE
jgi:hypothetical protein